MKKVIQILFLVTILVLSSCHPPANKSIPEKSTNWKKLNCGLFLSPEGELGFATDAEIANIPPSKLEGERCENVFLTHIGTDHKIPLSAVIDTNTFQAIGAGYFKDKSNIYSYYEMCSGGYLNIFSKDTTTFRVLGTCYASYQSHIYHYRNGLIDADAPTFTTTDELGQLAKDKNGFFSFGEKITEEQLKKEVGKERVEELKGL